jgi:hypothetical protein
MNIYPSWRYHRDLPARIVRDEAEDKALGPAWADSPAFPPEPEPAIAAPRALEPGDQVGDQVAPIAAAKPRKRK